MGMEGLGRWVTNDQQMHASRAAHRRRRRFGALGGDGSWHGAAGGGGHLTTQLRPQLYMSSVWENTARRVFDGLRHSLRQACSEPGRGDCLQFMSKLLCSHAILQPRVLSSARYLLWLRASRRPRNHRSPWSSGFPRPRLPCSLLWVCCVPWRHLDV